MRKRMISLCLAALLMFSLALSATAAEEGTQNFTRLEDRIQNFVDVSADSWYSSVVEDAQALGLMQGKGEGRFDPEGNVTLAETLALACRLHDIYRGGDGVFEQGEPWYQVYMEEAVARGILQDADSTDPEAPAIRSSFAYLLCAAFPAEAMEDRNELHGVPDVPESEWWAPAVLRLYRAGVLTGNDEYGTFAPDSCIRRCEVAAIVSRMADPALRRSFSLRKEPYTAAVEWLRENGTADYYGEPAMDTEIDGDAYYFYATGRGSEAQLRAHCGIDSEETEDYELTLELRLLREDRSFQVNAALWDGSNEIVEILTAEPGAFTQTEGGLTITAFWSKLPLSAANESAIRRNLKKLSELCARSGLEFADTVLQDAGLDGLNGIGFAW